MSEKKLDTTLLDKAIKYAVEKHSGVERRGKGFPYIIHPMEAATIVASITSDQELLAAAMLHDVVEDTDTSIDDIRKNFGERVASLVWSESDEEMPDMTDEESWHLRKEQAIKKLKNSSRDAKIVAIGDKLSNIRAIYGDYKIKGDDIWNIFHVKDKKEHEWHYRGLVDALSDLNGTYPFHEFEKLVNRVFTKE